MPKEITDAGRVRKRKTDARRDKNRGKMTKKLGRLIKATCRGKEAEDSPEEPEEPKEPEEEGLKEEGPQMKRPRQIPDRRPDVMAIPPSACDSTIFKMQQPFVQVVYSKHVDIPEGDRVRGGSSRMDLGTLKYAISRMSKHYTFVCITSQALASELAFREMHVALIKGFWWMTTPRKKLKVDTHKSSGTNEFKSEIKPGGIEEGAGLEIEVDTQVIEQTVRLSSNSLGVRLEGDEGEGQEKKKMLKYDIKCQVYDECIEGIDKSITVLVVECKWASIVVEDIFQAATYACEALKTNFEKGSVRPLHIEVWSETSWRYAVLYPFGLVQVQGENVVDIKGSTSSKESLSKEIEIRKRNERFWVEYPDGSYLHGLLYVPNETYAMPDRFLQGSLLGPGSRLFFESKLRILVGERVLKWTIDDVKKAVEVRKKAFKEKHAMLLDG